MNTRSFPTRPNPMATRWIRAVQRVPIAVLLLPSIALILSGVMTWASVGFGEVFLPRWGRSFLASVVVLPLALASLGAMERAVNAAVPSFHWVLRRLLVAALTACVLESVLALALTALNNPWDAAFGSAWWQAFSRSLPAGLVIGLFMGFYMKPKMAEMAQRQKARAASGA